MEAGHGAAACGRRLALALLCCERELQAGCARTAASGHGHASGTRGSSHRHARGKGQMKYGEKRNLEKIP